MGMWSELRREVVDPSSDVEVACCSSQFLEALVPLRRPYFLSISVLSLAFIAHRVKGPVDKRFGMALALPRFPDTRAHL